MKKNIVLIDKFAEINLGIDVVDNILTNTDWNISVLVTSEEKKYIYVNRKRIKKIYSTKEIYNIDCIEELDYELINKLKYIQSDYMFGTAREIHDINLLKLSYYNSISFWHSVFKNQLIDIVIITGFIQGFSIDLTIKAMAELYNIFCYTWNPISVGKLKLMIHEELNDKFLVKSKRDNIKSLLDCNSNQKNFYQINTINRNKLKYIIRKCLYSIGGDILVNIIIALLKNKRIYYLGIKGGGLNFIELFCEFCKMKKMENFLNKISVHPDYGEKYIIYFLQMEPEGTIQVRCTLQSQLVAIKMLSKALPKGWKIYIKEHPFQYKLNTKEYSYYLTSKFKYRTKNFYKEIMSLKNTKIIKKEISSKDLAQNSQAISTFNGTIISEVISMKKPALVFGGETIIYKNCKDILCIDSYIKCKEYIQKIKDGWRPNYDSIEDLYSKYTYEYSNEGIKEILNDIDRVVLNK